MNEFKPKLLAVALTFNARNVKREPIEELLRGIQPLRRTIYGSNSSTGERLGAFMVIASLQIDMLEKVFPGTRAAIVEQNPFVLAAQAIADFTKPLPQTRLARVLERLAKLDEQIRSSERLGLDEALARMEVKRSLVREERALYLVESDLAEHELTAYSGRIGGGLWLDSEGTGSLEGIFAAMHAHLSGTGEWVDSIVRLPTGEGIHRITIVPEADGTNFIEGLIGIFGYVNEVPEECRPVVIYPPTTHEIRKR